MTELTEVIKILPNIAGKYDNIPAEVCKCSALNEEQQNMCNKAL